MKKAFQEELQFNLSQFRQEEKNLRMQYFDVIKSFDHVDGIVDKLTTKVIEYEWILMELKKNLAERNIRRVYR